MLTNYQRTARSHGNPSSDWRERIAFLNNLESIRAASDVLNKNQQWLNQQHIELCRKPAPTFQEAARAEHLRQVLESLGHQSQIDDVGNVVTAIEYSKDLPYIAVTVHLDTTLVPSRPEGIQVELDGSMFGPGVTDNGCGLTALLALGKVLGRPLVDNPSRNILLIATVAEEGEGNLLGMRHLVHNSQLGARIDRFIVVDGSSHSHITTSALGSSRYKLVITGPGGHSWNDYGRVNPIHALTRAISLMTQAILPVFPRTSLSVGVIEGGESINAIPCSASAKIDVRSQDEHAIEKARKVIEEAAMMAVTVENQQSLDHSASYQLHEIGKRPAARALSYNPVADCFLAVDANLHIKSTTDYASTDANIPLSAGIPTVAVGAGGRGGNAHTPDEWYDPDGRVLGLRRLLLSLAGLQIAH